MTPVPPRTASVLARVSLITLVISLGCTVDRAGLDSDPGRISNIDGSVGDGGGACDCEDDNPCTDDVCTRDGECEHVANEGACNDGDFCNGEDTCSEGTCSVHAGTPCGAATLCDEDRQQCVSCLRDKDCPKRRCKPYGDCEYDAANVCAESGSRRRSCERFECQAGACVAIDDGVDSKDCHRDTDNLACGEKRVCTPCGCNSYGYCYRYCRDQEFACDEAECVLDQEDTDEIEDCDPF